MEIEVLRLVWRDEPCTERHVSEPIQLDRDVARTTVLKTIRRLESKGLLKRVAGTRPVRFRAVLDANRRNKAGLDRRGRTMSMSFGPWTTAMHAGTIRT